MFALVLYTDDILFICDVRDVEVRGKICSAKYSDKKKYAARVLAVSHQNKILAEIKDTLEGVDSVTTNCMITGEEEFSYRKIAKKLTKNADDGMLYVDKTILSLKDSDNFITIFSMGAVKEQKDFFDKPSNYLALRIVYPKETEGDMASDEQERIETAEMDSTTINFTGTNENSTMDENLNDTYTVSFSIDPFRPSTQLEITDIENAIRMLDDKENLLIVADDNDNFTYFTNSTVGNGEIAKAEPERDTEVTLPIFAALSEDNMDSTLSQSGIFDEPNKKSTPLRQSEQSNVELPNNDMQVPVLVCSQSTEINPENKNDHAGSDNETDELYEPSDNESSDSNLSSGNDELTFERNRNGDFSRSLNITIDHNDNQRSAPDDTELHVDTSAAPHAKKNFCMYCKTFQTKLARHLQNMHSEEDDVKKFMALPPKNKERQKIIAQIRKNGNHMFNTNRMFNTGSLLVCRRPNIRMQKTAADFIPCGNCKGQYARSVIRHHWRRCTKRSGKHERIIFVKGRKISARLHERASTDVRKYIFPYMREDDIVRGIRYDELMILFANKQCQKYGAHQHQYQMIRARLRLLGRFFDEIKKIDKRINTFADVFQPRYYDAVILSVRKVSGFNNETKIYEHPAVATNLGTLLKQIGELLRSEYIKRELDHDQKRVEDFVKLMVEDYGTSINRAVLETQVQNYSRKKVVLPTTNDIKKLNTLLKTERTKSFEQLQQRFSFAVWKKLSETTLLSLQVFNRRRPGEVERLYLDDFRSYRSIDVTADKDSYDALSEEGKSLARKYVRFEIRGKLGRCVPVLIDTDLLDCINLIIQHREDAKIPARNQYLFGLPSQGKDRMRHLSACDLMREYAKQCGAAIPEVLRRTQLRKHIATKCVNLNLTDGQVTDLANFMGHHEKIHKQIYRQPVLETDIVSISKLLKAAQGSDESSDDSDISDGEISQRAKTSDASCSNKTPTQRNFSKRWSDIEKTTVLSAFKDHLVAGKVPSGRELQDLIDNNDCLKKRTVPQIRTWVHNQRKNSLRDNS